MMSSGSLIPEVLIIPYCILFMMLNDVNFFSTFIIVVGNFRFVVRQALDVSEVKIIFNGVYD